MNLETAAHLLDVKENELSPFEVTDSFNGNILSGFLCHRSDHRYGALVLSRVNDWDCEQIIYCTPKIHYPFDKQGTYNWPDVKEVQFWDKKDGTNIFAYHYYNKDTMCVTFKTRLTPVIKDGGMLPFKSMLEEYMNENRWVRDVIFYNSDHNLSFELFGSRNPITIKYDVPLEMNLLFGVRRSDRAIKPPLSLNIPEEAKIPSHYFGKSGSEGGLFSSSTFVNQKENLTKQYNAFREMMSNTNKLRLMAEGMVLYAHVGEPSWKQFKCKPEEIEKIHWAASGSIPEISLKNTALNVFEDKEDPTIDDFRILLLEEYPENLITKSSHKIEGAWKWALERVQLVKEANEVWIKAKEQGLDITKDKGATMRFISNYFPKSRMSVVGTVILGQAGLLKRKR